jgi:APA family basic amino acid/polyamine antiporter
LSMRRVNKPPPEAVPLRRAISRTMLLMLVVGDVLGAGIYALVGQVAGRVGGAFWVAFLLALTLAVFTAFGYAELVTKFPKAAGAAVYVNRAWAKPFLTFLVAFAVMCSGLTSAATLARAFVAGYGPQSLGLSHTILAIVFIVLVALVNYRGISESARLNVGLTIIELVGLLIVLIVGIAAIAVGSGDVDPSRVLQFTESRSIPASVMAGVGLAFFALIGFEDSVNMAEEVRDPARDYPWALLGGLLVAGTLYVLVTVVASMVVPAERLAGSPRPLLEVVQAGPLKVPTGLFAVISMCALANGALINMLMASRIVYGMSRERILPPGLGRVDARRQTPLVAIVGTTGLAILLIITGELSDLADTTVLLLLMVFTGVNLAVLALRRTPVASPYFRAPTAMPWLGAIVSVALMATKTPMVFARAGALLLLGAGLWFINSRLYRQRQSYSDRSPAAEEQVQGPAESATNGPTSDTSNSGD